MLAVAVDAWGWQAIHSLKYCALCSLSLSLSLCPSAAPREGAPTPAVAVVCSNAGFVSFFGPLPHDSEEGCSQLPQPVATVQLPGEQLLRGACLEDARAWWLVAVAEHARAPFLVGEQTCSVFTPACGSGTRYTCSLPGQRVCSVHACLYLRPPRWI